MDTGDQPGCILTCHLSELYLVIPGVPYHSNCTHPTPLQLEQSPADMQGPWIHEAVTIPVHVHPLDTIGTRVVRPGTMFPVINSPMLMLTGPDEE
jgi:hypothetical protein